jgi:hypothetical protein
MYSGFADEPMSIVAENGDILFQVTFLKNFSH